MALLKTALVGQALRVPWVTKLLAWIVPPLDKFLLRVSRGWLSVAMQTVVLMETVGARSGRRRETVTLCMPDSGNIVLLGSNWGRAQHPAWVFNLRIHAKALIRFRGYVGAMFARELEGAERDAMWERLIEYNPQYAHYAARTSRQLPIVVLAPVNGSP